MNKRTISLSLAALLGSASSVAFSAQDYAEVLSATPIYRDVRVSEPRQQCYQQHVVYDNGYSSNVTAGTVIGGVAGGVIGHQIGAGSGNVVATAAGAVIGALSGQRLAAVSTPPPGDGYEEHCTTVNAYHYESRPDGYDVTYRYYGQIYHTRLREDPGPTLPVQVDVRPSSY
jgi:uncharacterized protein YcfJ